MDDVNGTKDPSKELHLDRYLVVFTLPKYFFLSFAAGGGGFQQKNQDQDSISCSNGSCSGPFSHGAHFTQTAA